MCYRRDDAGHAQGLHERLVRDFGDENVVIDINDFPPGEDFVTHIGKVVGACDFFLALIGPRWASATDGHGQRRLDDPADFVRLEIVAALTSGVPIIPVLVGDTEFPRPHLLPMEIREMTAQTSIRLRTAAWHDDVDRLIDGLRRLSGRSSGPAPPVPATPPSTFASPTPTPAASRSGQATTVSHAGRAQDTAVAPEIFISYVEEDSAIACRLAKELRAQQQTTWLYEEDGFPGVSYLTQVFRAINACKAVVLVASGRSIRARQVIKEVEAAHERDKKLIAVRVGMTQEQLMEADEIVLMALGTSVTLPLDDSNVASTAKRIAGAMQHIASHDPGDTAR